MVPGHATSHNELPGNVAMASGHASSPWAVAQGAYGQMNLMPIGPVRQILAAQMPQARASPTDLRSDTNDQLSGMSSPAHPALNMQASKAQAQNTVPGTSKTASALTRANQAHQSGQDPGREACSATQSMGMSNITPGGRAAIPKTTSTPASSQRRASVPAQLHASPRLSHGSKASEGLRAAHEHGQRLTPVTVDQLPHGNQNRPSPPSMAAFGLRATTAPPEADKDVTAKKVAADVWGIHLRRYSGKY